MGSSLALSGYRFKIRPAMNSTWTFPKTKPKKMFFDGSISLEQLSEAQPGKAGEQKQNYTCIDVH